MTNHAQAGSARIDLSSPVAILSERSSGCAVSGKSQHTRLHVLDYLRVDLPSARNSKTRRFRFLNKPRGVHLLMVFVIRRGAVGSCLPCGWNARSCLASLFNMSRPLVSCHFRI